MNPTFIPMKSISHATRQGIHSLYEKDPNQWTPRALAEQFGLSIVRIQVSLAALINV
jgi:hypothetical protein